MSEKIIIIKLGAKGDVVRTMPILLGIKEKYTDSEITWITKPQCKEILQSSPYIDHILTLPINPDILQNFNLLYNFDIEEQATTLAKQILANKKLGFYKEHDFVQAFNLPAEYYLNTLFDDEIKKTNTKTYQQIMFEIAELPYKKQHHLLYLTEQDKQYAENFLKQNNINPKKLIGLHIGSSPRWPSKAWHQEHIKEFIKKAKDKGYEILLFGGPDEIQEHKKLAEELERQELKIYRNNPLNTDKEFFSLMSICKKIITGDSYALHIALALKKPTIALFFCTTPDEVEDYNILIKIVSPRLYDFFPEKCDIYDEELTKSITPSQVLDSLKELDHKTYKNPFL